MTKQGKCDICRLRKVKCDEVKPICGCCAKRNRPCAYTYRRGARFVDGSQRFQSVLAIDAFKFNSRPDSRLPSPLSTPRRPESFTSSAGTPSPEPEPGYAPPHPQSHAWPHPHPHPYPYPHPYVHQRLHSDGSITPPRSSSEESTFGCEGDAYRHIRPYGAGPEAGPAFHDAYAPPPPPPVSDINLHPRSLVQIGPGCERDGAGDGHSRDLAALLSDPRLPEPAARLLHRWMAFVDGTSAGHDARHVFSSWMRSVPRRVGRSAVVDLALDCFLRAVYAPHDRRAAAVAEVDRANARALGAIRAGFEAVPPARPGADSDSLSDLLLAVVLIYHAALFIRPECEGFMFHQTGLISLIQKASKNGMHSNEVIQNVLEYCIYFEFSIACLEGRPSSFDSRSWMARLPQSLQLSDSPTFSASALKAYTQHCWIRVPHLIQLVRQCTLSPEDVGLRTEATSQAVQLYIKHFDVEFQSLMAAGVVSLLPTADPALARAVPFSYDFASHCVYSTYINYWALRVILSGLVLSLSGLFPVIPTAMVIDPEAATAQDVASAENLAMCVQFAAAAAPAVGPSILPLGAMRLLQPLAHAFGAWHRLGMRSDAAHAEAGRDRKRWCVDAIAHLSACLGRGGVSELELVDMAEKLAGGPRRIFDFRRS